MWMVELRFTPTPERLAARPAHRALLATLHSRGVVRMAGPFADDSGAALILYVPDSPALDAVLAADPYFTTDGVQVAHVREWNPVVG